ncbi:hypothetical protein IGI37_003131 [Enterococcus sp. AZ194]|uniref:phage tail protein n=1 Tax=Enterococcus sp. AZ194 TaxID=2774629 RepID=UPI003F22F46B
MYKVIYYGEEFGNQKKVIHEPYNYGNKIFNGQLELSLEGLGISTFECTIGPQHELYKKIRPFKNRVEIYDNNKKRVFDGRVVNIRNEMSSNGQFAEKILCEDAKSYLYDSVQSYQKPTARSTKEYLGLLLQEHNKQVESHKQIYLGKVTVVEKKLIAIGIDYKKTADIIKESLLNELGGYLILRQQEGRFYLDYLKEYGRESKTPLQITRNLKSANRELEIDNLVTQVVPLGEEIKTADSEEANSSYSKPRIDISSVNDGKIYLEDKKLVQEFGVIRKSIEFSDIKNKQLLKEKGLEFLEQQKTLLVNWSVEAIELGLLDKNYEFIELGNSYPVDNPLLYETETLQVIEKKVDLLNPQKIVLTIGVRKKTLSQMQGDYKKMRSLMNHVNTGLMANSKQILEIKKQTDQVNGETQVIKEQVKVIPFHQKKIQEMELSIDNLRQQIEGTVRPPLQSLYRGSNISEQNKEIDWMVLKATGHTFVMLHVAYGTVQDQLIEQHIQDAIAAKMKVGLYLTSYAIDELQAVSEAEFICNVADKYKEIVTLPVAWNWGAVSERYALNQGVIPTKELVSSMGVAFLKQVKQRGYLPMNYSDLDYYTRYFDNQVKEFDWWLSYPGEKFPNGTYAMWQNEREVDGKSRGISGKASFNLCFVNYE